MMIGHSRPTLGPREEQAVLRALHSGQLAAGPEVAAFEGYLALRLGRRHALAVNSGHAALHLGLLALGAGPGRRVILPTWACAALLNAVRYTGAEPAVVDVDGESGNLTAETIRPALSRDVCAVIAPHMLGEMADIAAIAALGVPVIEDCAMAAGARAGAREAGAAGGGAALAVFSFYATKMLTTGQGGMVLIDDDRLAAELRDLVRYDHRDRDRLVYNYGLTEPAAALGRVQLERLDEFLQRRRAHAAAYRRAFADRPAMLPRDDPGHAWFRFCLRLPAGTVDAAVARLAAAGIESKRPVYQPIHRLLGLDRRPFPAAEALHETLLSVPIYPELEDWVPAEVARRVE